MKLRRWQIVARDVNGRVMHTEPFFFRRSARSAAAFHNATAVGGHTWQSTLPLGPLFTVTVESATEPKG